MSPALQKLRKELDAAKGRYLKRPAVGVVAGPNGPVDLDVIEMLYAAIAAQDAEIRKLKAERNIADGNPGAEGAGTDSASHGADADAYVGHTEVPANPPTYNLKRGRPQKTGPLESGG